MSCDRAPVDYRLLEREECEADKLDHLPSWDLFLSAYDGSERVQRVFESVTAGRKDWLIHWEYGFAGLDMPPDGYVPSGADTDEAEFWEGYFQARQAETQFENVRMCVDITGVMRPHLMLLPKLLRDRGLRELDVIYSEPVAYSDDEATRFSTGPVKEVRQVRGFEGVHLPGGEVDVLVVGVGYEAELIRRTAENKRAATKIQLFSLPSLRPHMYEESRLNARDAAEAMGRLPRDSVLFAPAADPFVTAQVLQERVEKARRDRLDNLYLCPLATKAQALGFALYYLCECVGDATSIIFPFSSQYRPESSVGLARVWRYRLELDWFQSTAGHL